MSQTEEVTLDVESWCRLCLKEHKNAHSVFAEDTQLSIPMRLMACLSLEAKPTDGLPKMICTDCRYQLEKSFLFRQRSQTADKKLRKHNRLVSMGKRSRVFTKSEDNDSDEDELEFEESIAFINKVEGLREESSEAWREMYKLKKEKEFANRLDSERQDMRANIRQELMEEVRSEVRQQLHDEVQEENRKEQMVKLLGELEVFLADKKAGLWEPTNEPHIKSKPADQPPQAFPVSKSSTGTRKRSRISSPILTKRRAKIIETEEVEYILGGDSKVEPLSNDDTELDTSTPDTAYNDINIVGTDDVVTTQNGEIYIINAAPPGNSTPANSSDFEQDKNITSYNIRDNGEIQFTDSKAEEMGDVVVFNLNSEECEDQPLYEFKEKVIILSKEKDDSDLLVRSNGTKGEFVVKKTPPNTPPRAGRVTDTLKTFQCQLCPIAFATEKMLSRHLNVHIKTLKNGTGGALKCPVCELQLSCASSLKRHMIIHTGLKPFKCQECDLSFSQREVLKRHMDIHTGEKRHKCPHCEACFAQKTNLHQHISRLHLDGERQHKCHLCDRTFHHVSGLSRHLVTHAGVSFACKECGRQFNDRSAVQRHVQNVHRQKGVGNEGASVMTL